ncbi:MAG: ATP-dependent helicase, partial [Oscillospiraceae bacterium]|nr:ATP-dependent helicase [Oscillospiraceae bacterium]
MTYEAFKAAHHLTLNAQQDAAVQALRGQVLLLAVPGSGKTTVLVARLGYLLACGAQPEEILTMTYTVAATGDMRGRFAALFGRELAARMTFATINGVSARIIRHYARAQGRTAFSLVTDDRALSQLVGELYRAQTGTYATESDIQAARTAITYAKNMQLTGDALDKVALDGVSFAPLYHAYCQALRDRGQMDFDDQLVYACQILRKYPAITAHFQAKWRNVCVDEAQDTSKIQMEIISLLQSGNLFLVGDEDQSIYGFRAAYPDALMTFPQDYPGATTLLMEQNYRSTPQIVSAADRFIAQNCGRHPKHMVATRPDGAAVMAIPVADRRAQYRYLLELAKNSTSATAVLFRDNDSALPVIDLLARAGVGFSCRQREGGFFTSRVVTDLTDILRFSLDPTDAERFLRIYFKLGAGISKASATQAAQSGGPVLSALLAQPGLSPWTKKQCTALRTHFANLVSEPADRAVYRIVHFMGYGDYLDERGMDANKADILEALGAEEPTPARLLARLDELAALVQQGAQDAQSKLILSTIHSSKGLEYDRVILMDVADGIFPSAVPGAAATADDRRAYEEERRLFYVGMTRAREQLSIFRFRKASLASTFAASVFPEPSGQKASRGRVFTPPPGASTAVLAMTARCVPGTRVCHRQFGAGNIVAREGDLVTILFDS